MARCEIKTYVTPDIPEADRTSSIARGRDLLDKWLSVVVARLVVGRSTLQDAYMAGERRTSHPALPQEAAE